MSKRRSTLRGVAVGLSLLVSWALLAPPVHAQETVSPVFAIIDVQRVLRESTAVKSLTQAIGAQRDKYQEEIRAKEDALRTTDKELARQRTILAAQVFAEKRRELEQKVASLQREVKERKRGLDQLFSKGMSQVQAELADVATEIAEERGLDLVLSKASVVLVKPKFELTNDVLERLNERLPELTDLALPN